MRLITVFLGMNILIFPLEFPCIAGTMRGKRRHRLRSFSRNDQIFQRNVVKRKPPETKKTKFFLICTKEEDNSLKCKPVSSSSHHKAKKRKNEHPSKKEKTKNYHNLKNTKGQMDSQRPKYIAGKGRLENKTYVLYNNDNSTLTNDDVNSTSSMLNNKTISKQLKSIESISEPVNNTDERKTTDVHHAPYVHKFTDIRNATDTQDNTDIGNATEVHNVTDYAQNSTEKRNTNDGRNITDMHNTTDIQNMSTPHFSYEQTDHRNIVLDLNVIMESVMARRHEYLQQQIEDGILDSSYVVADKPDNVQQDIEDAITDAGSLHKLANVVTSTISIEESNPEDTDNIVREFLDSFLNNRTTPLLKETPNGVKVKYNGTSSVDTGAINQTSVLDTGLGKNTPSEENQHNRDNIHATSVNISFTSSAAHHNHHIRKYENDTNNFYRIEVGMDTDSSSSPSKHFSEIQDSSKRNILNSSSSDILRLLQSNMFTLSHIQSTRIVSHVNSTRITSDINSTRIVSDINSTQMANADYSTTVDGINNLFETGLDYFPVDRVDDLFADTTNIQSTASMISSSNNRPTILNEVICDMDPIEEMIPIRSLNSSMNATEAESNSLDVYNEFVSAYQQIYGNAKVDLTQEAEDVGSSNFGGEPTKDDFQTLVDFHNEEEKRAGLSTYDELTGKEVGTLPYIIITKGNESEAVNSAVAHNEEVDVNKKFNKPKNKGMNREEDFLLLKKNNISLPVKTTSKKPNSIRMCYPRERYLIMKGELATLQLLSSKSTVNLQSSMERVQHTSSTISPSMSTPSDTLSTESIKELDSHQPPTTKISSSQRTSSAHMLGTGSNKNRVSRVSTSPSMTRSRHHILSTKSNKDRVPTSSSVSQAMGRSRDEKSTLKLLVADYDSKDVCGKNFFIHVTMPPSVHQYSKSEIKKKIELAITILYSSYPLFQSCKVVWIHDLISKKGPAVGVDIEVYFSNRGCEHLIPLITMLAGGALGQFPVYEEGVIYSSLDDRMSDIKWCHPPCSNPTDCYPTCNSRCCEARPPLPEQPNTVTYYPIKNDPAAVPLQYMLLRRLADLNNNNNMYLTNNNPIAKNGVPPAVVYCDTFCRWLCIDNCNPECCTKP